MLAVKVKLADEETWTIITVYGENEDKKKKKKQSNFSTRYKNKLVMEKEI